MARSTSFSSTKAVLLAVLGVLVVVMLTAHQQASVHAVSLRSHGWTDAMQRYANDRLDKHNNDDENVQTIDGLFDQFKRAGSAAQLGDRWAMINLLHGMEKKRGI